MDIIGQLILIAFLLSLGFCVVVGQAIAISRIHRTLPWTLLAMGLTVIGVRQVWNLVRLPIALEQARIRGTLPESLTWEQTILIGSAFVGVGLLIAGFDILRRHYRNIGI
jgi:hypothetical protein